MPRTYQKSKKPAWSDQKTALEVFAGTASEIGRMMVAGVPAEEGWERVRTILLEDWTPALQNIGEWPKTRR